jgi:hypothetical protein
MKYSLFKKRRRREKSFIFYFLRAAIDPPIIDRIASINPNIGVPVCCIGIVVVAAFNIVVVLVGVVGSVGVIGLVGFTGVVGSVEVIVIGSTPMHTLYQ